MDDLLTRYNKLLRQYEVLHKENEVLISLLKIHGIEYETRMKEDMNKPIYSLVSVPTITLSIDERIRLFQSLFKGREDVFARRWFSKTTGKSGYQPVCINEWKQGICDKKRYRCAICPNRNFAPLTSQDMYRHLEGKDEYCCDVVGLYAIMQDNNCAFLCADFDDKNCKYGYKEDVLAYVGVCREWLIPYAIERSRSGNGAHVWIFFEAPLPASKARRLGNAILTEAMTRNGQMSFNSYDRFFPNQDYLPEGGFGNLVALPLQGQARRKENSVFVDNDFLVYKDQWAFLYNLKKIQESTIDQLLRLHYQEELGKLSMSSESKPWVTPLPQNITQEDFHAKVEIIKADKLYIPLKAVSAKVLNHLKRIAAFKNPEFYSKQALRLSTYAIPRIISCFDITNEYLAMPRGCEDATRSFLNDNAVTYTITDKTNHGNKISVSFQGEEREEQLEAINALLPYTNGILHATTAFGKTVTAAAIIARKKVNTLILVHSKALLKQWHDRLTEFLNIDYPKHEEKNKRGRRKVFSPLGCFDSSGNTLHGIIDIALIQSCLDEDGVKPFVQDYGMVIVDECHHVSSITFEQVLMSIKAHTIYGLTATPIRKDGHQPIIFMQCGPIRFSTDVKSQIAKQSFDRFLIPRFTSYNSILEDRLSIATLYKYLSEDEIRNNLIVEDICKAVNTGRTPIILTNRTAHVSVLAEKLKATIKNVISLTGAGTTREKREAMQRLQTIPDSEQLVIVATGKYIGEGFDYPRLDTLFLALPISWKGLLTQYAGRLHREYEGKKDVRIYDYIDIHEPICDSMYRKRLKGYAAIGYKTINTAQPTLFDHINDISSSIAENQIFNGSTFYRPYTSDLTKAKRSIVISSPKLYRTEQNPLVTLLKELAQQGIEILITTVAENEQTAFIQSKGLSVKVKPKLSLYTTIIDKEVVWYGSINTLGYASKDDNMIKVTDIYLANELIKMIHKHS
ncbi:TOTE conflict system archaeo-eukaryotic primase domain-containing protein [Prevotella melaninogenica]|uniref:TOTE conflict system archaeo-eukaryotic primase domain-containing protein n=1 Tax=Prevotella melaninogenica TaxID=28132 RepID=UPI0001AEA495|nr:DEAD/DEAH box helicase family protein [Prevotella melaninogenica]ADK96983.1 DNA primase small subunit [Prevotella melaninogenica ATCC 25845]ASE18131.1 helicase [Prevotella melaninogenica]UEB09361.1 DEAD/DEAH box helicase family protein [Prevotella melaninogenica]